MGDAAAGNGSVTRPGTVGITKRDLRETRTSVETLTAVWERLTVPCDLCRGYGRRGLGHWATWPDRGRRVKCSDRFEAKPKPAALVVLQTPERGAAQVPEPRSALRRIASRPAASIGAATIFGCLVALALRRGGHG